MQTHALPTPPSSPPTTNTQAMTTTTSPTFSAVDQVTWLIIGSVAAALVVITIVTLVVVSAMCLLKARARHHATVNNACYYDYPQEVPPINGAYDYPRTVGCRPVAKSAHIKEIEAFAMNKGRNTFIEAKQNVAYNVSHVAGPSEGNSIATNTTVQRNEAYGRANSNTDSNGYLRII